MKLFRVVDAEECNRCMFDFGFGKVSEGEVFVAGLRDGVVVTLDGVALIDDGKAVEVIAHISTE